MKREDIQVLRDIQKNTELAMKAVDTVIDKVYDDDLAMQLSRQSLKYSQLHGQAVDRLLSAHLEPARVSVLDGLRVIGNLHKDTLFDTSTSHIAELTIRESSRKISKMYQTLHRYEGVESVTAKLAKEFAEVEKANIRQLQKFL